MAKSSITREESLLQLDTIEELLPHLDQLRWNHRASELISLRSSPRSASVVRSFSACSNVMA